MNTQETRFLSEYEEIFGVLGYSPRQIQIVESELHTEYRRIAARENARRYSWE